MCEKVKYTKNIKKQQQKDNSPESEPSPDESEPSPPPQDAITLFCPKSVQVFASLSVVSDGSPSQTGFVPSQLCSALIVSVLFLPVPTGIQESIHFFVTTLFPTQV